ncbi:glycoside hydrolase family 3 C-terminal domain-containing protein [Tessaracoccus sp. O5.2]|uniref:glycoside hydrolase family 3 protein n=1 Tax=Tessaracoccus sp. O5.2 TaxID=3157622 RepID=UPI0036DB8009
MPQELWRLYRRAMHRVVNGLAQQSVDIVDPDRTVAPRLVELCRLAAGEGVVLLRNVDGVLPLPAHAPVAVFGRVQCDWFAVGYGSGGDVKAPYEVSLLEALREAGVAVVGELAAAYETWSAANPPDEGYWGNWPRHFDEMPLDAGLVSRAAREAGVAVVVIGRAAGEDRESVLEPGSYYLTDAERAMLDAVVARFERVVVVVNTGNVMDLSWADDYGDRLAGLILAWQGGMEGSRGLVDVLTGAVSPSVGSPTPSRAATRTTRRRRTSATATSTTTPKTSSSATGTSRPSRPRRCSSRSGSASDMRRSSWERRSSRVGVTATSRSPSRSATSASGRAARSSSCMWPRRTAPWASRRARSSAMRRRLSWRPGSLSGCR